MLMEAMRKPDGAYRTYDEKTAENIPTKYIGVADIPKNPELSELTGKGSDCPDQTYSAFVSEVEVDEETGKTKILEMHCVVDAGVTTNVLSLEGQAYSGMMHGAGYALSEQFSDFKKHISLIGGGFTYIETMPDGERFTVKNLETPRDYSPFGGSGSSEGFQSAGHVSILNAVYNAVGIRVGSTPATPEKVKKAIDEKKNGVYRPQEPFDFGYDFDEQLDYMIANPPAAYSGVAGYSH
jgi:aldehyde oxidoreductase